MTDETPAKEQEGADAASPVTDLEALNAEIAALKDQVLRVAADAENTKRRTEREANDARAYAIQKFARDLLPVADNLSRALQHARQDSADPLVKNIAIGLEMTEKELLGAFERNGLRKIDPPRGAKFDPHQQQAVQEQTAGDVGPGAVLEVIQPGYELFGRLVRPALVVVASRESTGPQAASSPPGEGAAANPYAAANDESAGASVDTKA